MRYDKLVRDKIPEIIRGNGDEPAMHIAEDEEYGTKLKEKLHEELAELIEAENADEAADLLEVLEAFMTLKGISMSDVLETQRVKKEKRGGFEKRIILEEA